MFTTLLILSINLLAAPHRQAPLQPFPQQPVPVDAVIVLKRGGCVGRCPDYKVTVTGDGTVTYEGHRQVKKKGKVKSSISQEDVKRLISAFEAANYFSLKHEYFSGKDCPRFVIHAAYVTTSIKKSGKKKSVLHYHGCTGTQVLKTLTALEETIDEVLKTKQWVE
jgi:hypothetical protein